MRAWSLFFILFFISTLGFAQKVQFRRAQAVRPQVEIYNDKSFDAGIVAKISPGKFYYISNKTYGPFYKIKINEKIVGYVADTEIEIEGLGRLEEKPFVDDFENHSKSKIKKNKKARPTDEEEAETDEGDEDESVFHTHYHGLILNLVNYHEKTMDQTQVADLYAVGYRYIPFLSDYSASISWDVNIAYGVPKYYKDKLGVNDKGLTAWGGAQLLNISIVDRNKTLRYGIGPFLKYANYNLSTASKSYSLQELTAGLLIEGGFIFHFNLVSFDIGLRYYWERESYGGMSLGFLF